MQQQTEHPDDLRWKDRLNYILIQKVLGYCTKGRYEEALLVCEGASMGVCEEWNKQIYESTTRLYDLTADSKWLEKTQDASVIERIVEAGRTWVSCIPEYYKNLVTKAIGVFKEIDEFLEGRSLEVKSLIQMMQMRREGNSNEIFWFIKDAMGKYGTSLSLEQLQELYRKEKEKKESQLQK